MMPESGRRVRDEFSARIGDLQNAQRFTVNISAEVGEELRDIAFTHRVSESSIVEIALRQLFRRVNGAALGTFLHDHGACLRRRS
jgi:hypothetical protein